MISHNDCLDGQLTSQGQMTLTDAGRPWTELQLDPCVEGDFMAAQANLFVGNELEDPDGPDKTSVRNLKKMYDFMVANQVALVNESWGITNEYDNHGYLVDFYSRRHHVTFVQAAGELSNPKRQDITACQGYSALCVGGLQTDAGASADLGLFQTPAPQIYNGWILKAFSPRENKKEYILSSQSFVPFAEKPDLVAPATGAQVVGFEKYSASNFDDHHKLDVETTSGVETIDYWGRIRGTSFAAPLVAAALGAC
jgi:hypothetical protein